jgi:predicted ATP-binding protein involved in virulence
MKVKRLGLKGFRGFDEIVLDFDTSPQRPTVFIGNNGVGKSSILDALSILLSEFIRKVKSKKNRASNSSGVYSVRTIKINKVNFKNNHDTTDLMITIQYKNEIYYDWSFSNLPENEKYFQLRKLTDNIRDNLEKKNITSIPIIIHYPVNRSVIKIPLESKINYSTDILNAYDEILGNDGDRTSSPKSSSKLSTILNKSSVFSFDIFFEWFRNIEDLENENRRDDPNHRNKQLMAIRNSIHALIPEFDNLRVKRNPLRMTVNKTIGDKVEELSINQLSDGEKCLLAMVGDIARRLAIANPSLDDPLQGEGIVLIDEIELHLHPQWQHKIIPRLTETFPNCQFIVTTHSPQILSHVYPENIYILQSTPDGIIASQPESSYGRDSNQILENVMGVSAYPEDIEKDLSELFRLIERNDLVGAKQLREQLSSRMPGPSDPQLIKAGVIIKGKEILGK